MPTNYQDWDFRGNKLATDVAGQDFVTSESTLLLISPEPTYNPSALQQARAVALTQDMSFNQQRQVVQVHEVGSNQRYTISSSRTNDSMNISRVLFDGESLLNVLSPQLGQDGQAVEDFERRDKPGYGDFMINLGSSLFSKPVGLFAVFRDLEDEPVGVVFFERTFIVSHNMQVSSNSPFIGEGVQLLFDQMLPVQPQ
jgi:hypothetical protein